MSKEIIISTAPNRYAKKWKNERMRWEDFAAKCSRHQVSNIKDHGAYAGETSDGLRNGRSITSRYLITLDADRAYSDLWEAFTRNFPNIDAVCYSTFSHTEEKPRYRLVIRLNAPILRSGHPDDFSRAYEAAARYIAARLGIEQFDDCSYRVTQMMFWPVCPPGSSPKAYRSDGEGLDVNAILNTYGDWRDKNQWPVAPGCEVNRPAEGKKPQDPRGKPGFIGAFCRCYTVREAIEKFLADVYEPRGDRYAFIGSHSAPAVRIYDNDTFAYSDHDTDPASGRSLNAFDIVRLHRFGELDAEADADTPVNRLPSYIAMLDFCRNDPDTIQQFTQDRDAEALSHFSPVELDEIESAPPEWAQQLTRDRKGRVTPNPGNIELLCTCDIVLKKLCYNEFAGKTEAVEDSNILHLRAGEGLIDTTETCARNYLYRRYGLTVPRLAFSEQWEAAARHPERTFNPVKDFIKAERWDGIKRIDNLLSYYLGADDSAATREAFRKWCIAAVARIFNPGIKFDYVLTLEGPQGTGKSTFLKTLAGKWFNDSIVLDSRDKEKSEQILGSWICEFSDLNGLSRADFSGLKGWLSKTEDKFRPAYGRHTVQVPRSCIFAATTNNPEPLRDAEQGNRRWLMIHIDGAPEERSGELAEVVPQIWAEAYRYYSTGETLDISRETLRVMAGRQLASSDIAGDEMRDAIDDYINTPVPPFDADRMEWKNWYDGNNCAVGTQPVETICARDFLWEKYGIAPNNSQYGKQVKKFNQIMRTFYLDTWEELAHVPSHDRGSRPRGYRRRPG